MKKWLPILIPVLIVSSFFFFVTIHKTLEESAEEPKLPDDIGNWQKREKCQLSGDKVLIYLMFDKDDGVDPQGIFLAKVDGKLVAYSVGPTNNPFPEKMWVRQASGAVHNYDVRDKETYHAVLQEMRATIVDYGIDFSNLVSLHCQSV